MSVIRHPKNDKELELGLVTLVMAPRRVLENHPFLDELGRLYDDANDLDKGSILLCFMASEDPRGIPLFARVLDNAPNMKLRLLTASALAQWNVRRGVAELVELLDSPEEMPQPSHLFYVRDNAMRTFRLKNIHKGWGFPDDKEAAEAPPDVMPPPEVLARWKLPPTVEEIRKWFAENEARFPDWKPGDPLPEVEKEDAASKEIPAP